ncbi:MAG: UbiA family prenyltransferase, partial [Haloplanus sp.]
VFVWTPAHAWALAVVYRDEFATAGVATLPVVSSPDRVRRAIWMSALGTVAVVASLVPFAGPVYAATAVVAVPPFLFAYGTFAHDGGEARAVRAFFTSNTLLAAVFVGWGVGGVASGRPVAIVAAAATCLLFAGTWLARPSLRGVSAPPSGVTTLATRAYDQLRLRVTG